MSPMELEIQLQRHGAEPLWRQIAQAVQEQIRHGRLHAGDKLPPARELAARLAINVVTVVTAYRHLAADGWVDSRVGSGTYVSPPFSDPVTASPVAIPDAEKLFPVDALKRIMNHVLDTEGVQAFAYDEVAGYEPLRQTIRDYLMQNGFAPGRDEIVIFSGAQQGLSILVRVLVQRGDWVLVERPTYPGILRLLQRAGAQIEAVDLDRDGPDLRACAQIFRTRPVRLMYTMPVYQNPTGICYAGERQRQLLQLCREYGVTVIEDDAMSDLDFGRGRGQPLRLLSGPDGNVIYLKSFSHLMLPGFRLGFCLAPVKQAAAVVRAKEEADLFTSGFFQRVLRQFLEQGYFAVHLKRLEAVERKRFNAALRTAEEILEPAGFIILPPAGGTRLWCQLPPGTDPRRCFPECVRQEIKVQPGAEFAVDDSTAGGCCLSFDRLSSPEWRQTLVKLKEIAAVTGGRLA